MIGVKLFGKVSKDSLAALSHAQESRKVRRGSSTYIGTQATQNGKQAANGMAPGTAN